MKYLYLLTSSVLICYAPMQVQQAVAQTEISFEEADKLGDEAYSLMVEGKVQVAITVYERILPILAKPENAERWTFHALDYGYCFIKKGNYKQALEIFEDIRNRSTYIAEDDWLSGWLHNYTGEAYYYMGELKEAQKQYVKALAFIKKTDDTGSQSSFLNSYGATLRLLGDYENALGTYQKSIALVSDDESRKLAVRYNGIAMVFEDLSMYNAAKDYYERSLEYRKIHGSPTKLATIYNNIAKLEIHFGNYDQALVYYNKSLQYELEVNEPDRLAITYYNLVDLYVKLDDIEKAVYYNKLNTQLFSELDSPRSKALVRLAQGMIHRVEGNYEQARKFNKMALDIYVLSNQKNSAFNIYLLLANNQNRLNNNIKERQHIDSALAIAHDLSSNELMARALHKKANWHDSNGRHIQAERIYLQALDYATHLTAYQKIPLLVALAKNMRQTGKDRAYHYAEKAIDHMEKLRTRAGFVSSYRASVFEKYVHFYKLLASWYVVDRKQIDRAFFLIESAKSRAFIEDLELAASNFEQSMPDSLIKLKQQKHLKLNSLYSRVDTLKNEQQVEKLHNNILALETEYEAFLNQFGFTDIYQQKIEATNIISAQQAQKNIPSDAVAIEYAVLNNSVLIFSITGETISAQKISIDQNKPTYHLDFKTHITAYIDSLSQKADLEYIRKMAHHISTTLIQPIASTIEKFENLIVVPDGTLSYLPFETLLVEDRYLIEYFNVKYLPSLTTQTYIRDPNQKNKETLLAMAGAQFDQEVTYSPKRQNSLTALPYTVMEIDSIASLFEHTTIWKDELVTEKRFKNTDLKNYQYIHFATHGIINEEVNENTGLILTSREPADGVITDDGFLRLPEIFNLDLNAEMVVLSACNTGRGKLIEGEGILGLQRAFFTAGSSSLVVSLWSVYDRSTALIMPEFYQLLQSEKKQFEGYVERFLRWIGWDSSIPYGYKASAMRKAKLKMLEHPQFNHPVYWAPFVVLGR